MAGSIRICLHAAGECCHPGFRPDASVPTWAGGSDQMPPEALDAAIIFATVGDLVPLALKAVRRAVASSARAST